jgi:hypothetical protein
MKHFALCPVLFVVFALGTFLPFPAYALDLPVGQIQDDSGLRADIAPFYFQGSVSELAAAALKKDGQVLTLPGGQQVELRIDTQTGASQNQILVILARRLTDDAAAALYGPFPGWAQGSWVLARSSVDGSLLRIRVFLRSDPNCYIQFSPAPDPAKSLLDAVVYNAFVARGIPLPLSMQRLLSLPLNDALALAPDFPLRYFQPDAAAYGPASALISLVRSKLPGLKFGDDGAIDSKGRYVYIASLKPQPNTAQKPEGLNCSGFDKWVVDQILEPKTGKLLEIAPLKRHFGSRGNSFSRSFEYLDPFFGLDWTRNLAAEAWRVLRPSPFIEKADDKTISAEFEVRKSPFSAIITHDKSGNASVISYPGYLKDVGFTTDGLKALLYTLAIDKPNTIYLAAVSKEGYAPTTEKNLRGLPQLRRYFHVAVLVPWFNNRGNFQVTTFESAAETNINAFVSRYPQGSVNLAGIPLN